MVWYAAIYRSALHWSLLALLIVLFVKSRDLIKNDVNFTRDDLIARGGLTEGSL